MHLWTTLALTLLAATLVSAMPAHKGMPIEVSGDWQVRVGPGQVNLGGRAINVAQPVVVTIAPPQAVSVRDEEYASLPMFDPKAAPYRRGLHPRPLAAQECVCTGLLVEGSLKVKSGPGDAEAFVLDKDYGLESYWTALGRIEGSRIAEKQKVYLDYDYVPCRLDSIVVEANGQLKVVPGTPAANLAKPPTPSAGETAIANVWLSGPTTKLADANLYPIEPTVPVTAEAQAEKLLPKTLAKLRKGEKVLIIAWGDSVTCGGGVGNQTELWYQNRFAAELRKRFPQAQIELRTAGWGGRDSRTYMAQPRGSEKDFVRDVLEPKPDLVTIEFVNDAWLNGDALNKQYTEIMAQITGTGAEVILIAPHLTRPDWMKVTEARFDEDPRPYVRDLKAFARENNIALADGSALWCRLWRQGIPYITYEANWINHPDARGHELFVEALMGVFPAK
ncbi:MAG: GDSL-type esterase/lipase family protein [Armatimonadia bacterium]